jgi:hypothetical protein
MANRALVQQPVILSSDWSRRNRCVLHGRSFWVGDSSLSDDLIAVHDRSTTVLGGLWAVAGDVTWLAAAIASLAGSIQWATVRRLTVAGDVAKLAASVALLSFSLAVASEVIWATALVAVGRAVAALETAAEAATEATAEATSWRATSTTTDWPWTCCVRSRAFSLQTLSATVDR